MAIKKKIIISIFIVLVFTGIIIYFVIVPTIKDIKKINQAVYQERVDLETKYLKGQLLKKTLEDFEKIKPEEDKLTSIFIIKGNELEFITALEKIANKFNLEQKLHIEAAADGSSNGYSPLPLEIKINGDFIKLLQYLKNLEQLNYYFNVASLNIMPESKNENITANLSGEIYTINTQAKE